MQKNKDRASLWSFKVHVFICLGSFFSCTPLGVSFIQHRKSCRWRSCNVVKKKKKRRGPLEVLKKDCRISTEIEQAKQNELEIHEITLSGPLTLTGELIAKNYNMATRRELCNKGIENKFKIKKTFLTCLIHTYFFFSWLSNYI